MLQNQPKQLLLSVVGQSPGSVWVRLSAARTFGSKKSCCLAGMKYIPKSVTCQQFADQAFQRLTKKDEGCKTAFRQCCEFYQQHLDQSDGLVLGRYGESGRFRSVPSGPDCDA